jgi:hypothetical protein
MLILASTDKLQVVTGSAGNIQVHASWMDNASGAIGPGRTNTPAITGAGTVDIVASPAAGVFRAIKTLHIRNTAVTSNDVTVRHTDGTTTVELYKITLAPGQTLQYIDEVGFLSTAASRSQTGSFIHGLKGAPQASRTKVDFTYDEGTLRNPVDGSVQFITTQAFTIDITVQGLNGRDQAAALPDVGIHFYAIWGAGQTSGGLCSTSPPPGGPAMPTGYTHWAYLTTLRKDSGQIVIVHVEGSGVTFDPQVPIISGGNANSASPPPTAPIDMTGFVPNIATNVLLEVQGTVAINVGGGACTAVVNLGPINGGFVSRVLRVDVGDSLGVAGPIVNTNSFSPTIPNLGQYFYIWNPVTNGGNIQSYAVNIWVAGYEVPNGD